MTENDLATLGSVFLIEVGKIKAQFSTAENGI